MINEIVVLNFTNLKPKYNGYINDNEADQKLNPTESAIN